MDVLGLRFLEQYELPSTFKGLPLYELHLKQDSLSKNYVVNFLEGQFYVKDIILYDILLKVIVFEVEDDIMTYCCIKIK